MGEQLELSSLTFLLIDVSRADVILPYCTGGGQLLQFDDPGLPGGEFSSPSPRDGSIVGERGKKMVELTVEGKRTLVRVLTLILAFVVVASALLLKYDKRRMTVWAVTFGLGLSVFMVSFAVWLDHVLQWSFVIGFPGGTTHWLRRLIGL
jgi:hypothetical protein